MKEPRSARSARKRSKPTASTQVAFQLKKVLEEHGARGHGTIQKLVAATGLERHLVSNLIQGKARSISWETLGLICQYLHDKHNVQIAELPGILFGFEATEFWSMLARCNVTISLGVRSVERVEPRWVNAYDAYLLGALMKGLFRLGRDQLTELRQHLVRSYNPNRGLQACVDEAVRIHKEFRGSLGDRALVCLGSVKSNPVSECVVAELFGLEPFTPEDRVRSPRRRRCPFYFQFRQGDLRPRSCHGGMDLATSRRTHRPGIHFETSSGHWDYCPATKQQDAGLILYSYRPHEGTMELVFAGFSGRATGAIAQRLHELSLKVWPPNYDREHLKLGAFIVRFQFDEPDPSRDPARPILVEPARTDVIRLDSDVLTRRLG